MFETVIQWLFSKIKKLNKIFFTVNNFKFLRFCWYRVDYYPLLCLACSCNIFWEALNNLSLNHPVDSRISLSAISRGQGKKFNPWLGLILRAARLGRLSMMWWAARLWHLSMMWWVARLWRLSMMCWVASGDVSPRCDGQLGWDVFTRCDGWLGWDVSGG